MKLFSGVGVFKHQRHGTNFVPQYEERTVIVRANDYESADKVILKEFQEYSSEGISLLERYEILELEDSLKEDVVEVTSFIRVSDLSSSDYLETYQSDLRPQSCTDKVWKHEWYRQDDETLACYNCMEIKKV